MQIAAEELSGHTIGQPVNLVEQKQGIGIFRINTGGQPLRPFALYPFPVLAIEHHDLEIRIARPGQRRRTPSCST